MNDQRYLICLQKKMEQNEKLKIGNVAKCGKACLESTQRKHQSSVGPRVHAAEALGAVSIWQSTGSDSPLERIPEIRDKPFPEGLNYSKTSGNDSNHWQKVGSVYSQDVMALKILVIKTDT